MKHTAFRSVARASLVVSLLLLLAMLSTITALAKSKAVAWKTVDDALLRVNGEAPKDWSVSQSGKKNDPLLLQLGNRFLLLETRDHNVFEIDPKTIKHHADELRWSLSDRPAQPLPSEWTTEDLGSAFRIAFTLPKQSLAFDLQIPHPPDYGDLPAHTPSTQTRRRY